ncbi:MAG: heparinase II/III family protein, partial [Actinomycetes bacterium]
PTPAPTTGPPPLVMPTALGSWCTTLFPVESASVEKRKAQELMAGKVVMFQGGTYYISQHPNWRPQSGTDTSGDRHVNSLRWALPLLYRGVHKQNPVLIERFRQLMYYWINDHKGKRGAWVDGSIYGGMRSQTLVCAAQTLNEPVLIQAALRDAATMVSGYRAPPLIAVGANNTDLIRQTGAFAAYCWTGNVAARERAWANLVGVAHGVVQGDGSDVEGSPGYAVYIEKLLTDVDKAAATCGLQSDNIKALRASLYSFVAQAVRPDFKLESLGDSINESLRGSFGIGDGTAEWIRSAGTAGSPSAPIYGTFDGGYAFGRAGWRPQVGGPDTYYSLRYSSTRPITAHTHDDGGSLTLFSRGVSWIGDPGPYRYDNSSSLRWFVKSRPAHSTVMVSKVARTRGDGVRKITSRSDWQLGGNDTTCLADRTWGSVGVVRCATYVRSVDAMIVVDYANAKKIKGKKQRKKIGKRLITERWQIPPGVGAQNVNDVITLSSGDKRLDILKSGPGSWAVRTAGGGSSIGWFTGKWGQKLPGVVLSRGVPLKPKGDHQTMVTVFVPRVDGENVPVVVDANGVTITRGATTVTTALPVAF